MYYQDIILTLESFWSKQGCVLLQPYNSEVGAGTFNPATFLRALGPEPWRAAYVEPSKRPKDGRYGMNPNRLQQFFQYQVVMKPPPPDIVELYFQSLEAIGIDSARHDLRLVEDDWESPTLGAWGMGWQVWLDGMEITQFTYFQQAGGVDLDPVMGEITYGPERIAICAQGVDTILEVELAPGLKWSEVWRQNEKEFSAFNFSEANVEMLFSHFNSYESECFRLMEAGLLAPAYDYVIKCSHVFNLLEARGAISVTERTGYIARVRRLARKIALAYIEQREEQGFPLKTAGVTGWM